MFLLFFGNQTILSRNNRNNNLIITIHNFFWFTRSTRNFFYFKWNTFVTEFVCIFQWNLQFNACRFDMRWRFFSICTRSIRVNILFIVPSEKISVSSWWNHCFILNFIVCYVDEPWLILFEIKMNVNIIFSILSRFGYFKFK